MPVLADTRVSWWRRREREWMLPEEGKEGHRNQVSIPAPVGGPRTEAPSRNLKIAQFPKASAFFATLAAPPDFSRTGICRWRGAVFLRLLGGSGSAAVTQSVIGGTVSDFPAGCRMRWPSP